MRVPVVLINKTISQCGFLEYTVKQACRNKNEVFLIGDAQNKHYCDGIKAKWINNEIYSSCTDFENLYEHLSTNHKAIEVFCFSRWFILRDFMRMHMYEAAVYIDSDVLYFANAEKEFKQFENYYCALSGRTSGHTSYWTLKGLEKFCNYLLRVYGHKQDYDYVRLTSIFNDRQKFGLHGGVCDMTLLEHFARYEYPHMVGEVSILTDNPYHDHIVSVSEGFEMDNGIKKFIIDWEGQPYSIHVRTNALIQFASIHCQGNHKHLIKTFYDAAEPKRSTPKRSISSSS